MSGYQAEVFLENARFVTVPALPGKQREICVVCAFCSL